MLLPAGTGRWNRAILRTQFWQAFHHSSSSPRCLLPAHPLSQLPSIAKTHPEASCQEVLVSCSLLSFPGGLSAGQKAERTMWFCPIPISSSFPSAQDGDGQHTAAPRIQPKPWCVSKEAEGRWAGGETITSGRFSSQAWELAEKDAEESDRAAGRGGGHKSSKAGTEQLCSSILQGIGLPPLLWKLAGVGEDQPKVLKRQP